jgi:hypothetical protein
MTFLIGGANSLTGGYEIDNSLRFNDDDNPSLSRANDSGGSNTAGTLSFWTKRSEINTGYLFFARSDDSNVFNVYFSNSSTNRLEIRSSQGGSVDFQYKTNMIFRDPAAWYHIVIAIDTTDGTAADRCKLFVNGSRITSFNTQTNFGDSDTIELFQSDATVYVSGEHEGGTIGSPYDGYIADLNFVDGTQYDASNFGETNDNGVWIPKKFGGTQGTNGFRLEFKQTGTSANASGMGADTSGNTNHLTPSNLTATDVTTDTPTNNFCTWNNLATQLTNTFSEGNVKVTIPGNNVVSGATTRGCLSTIALARGKWYYEIKYTADAVAGYIGLIAADTGFNIGGSTLTRNFNDNVGYIDGGSKTVDGSHSSYGDSFTDADVLSVAVNFDDNEVHFYKNGTIQNSGTAISKTFSGSYFLTNQHTSANGTSVFELNTGNPSFAISSGNADANGYGNFEYAVPSGYYAICTKNLAEYG